MRAHRVAVLAALAALAVGCASRPSDLNTGDRGEGAGASLSGALQPLGRMGTEECGKDVESRVNFTDSELLDENLAYMTRRGHAPVIVGGLGDRKTDELPPRLQRWLWEVKAHGGTVTTKTEFEGVAQRNFVVGWLIDIVAAAIATTSDFGGLYHYDAEVIAVERMSGEDRIRRLKEVRFVCRVEKPKPAAPADDKGKPAAPAPESAKPAGGG